MRKKIMWLLASYLVVALLAASCGPGEKKEPTGEEPVVGKKSPTEMLEILSHSMRTEQTQAGTEMTAVVVVEGTAKNITSSTLSRAEIRAVFFNSDKEEMARMITFTEGLKAGEIWNWQIKLHQSVIARAGGVAREFGVEKGGVASYKVEVGVVY